MTSLWFIRYKKQINIRLYRYIYIYLMHLFEQNEMDYTIDHYFKHWVHATY